ncbi:MAG: hypothetical protein R3316_08280, partial [Rhodovibrionaceae bacterium]|nr:hypothetical protein [Rhodovibrionaceae bacterium]
MTDKKSHGSASTRLRFVTLATALTLTASILSASAIERGALASHETSESQDAQPLQSTPASPDAAAGAAAGAEHFTPEEREALDAIIRDYLLENPEV